MNMLTTEQPAYEYTTKCCTVPPALSLNYDNSETAFQCPSVVSVTSKTTPRLPLITLSTDCVGNKSIIKTTPKTTHSTSVIRFFSLYPHFSATEEPGYDAIDMPL